MTMSNNSYNEPYGYNSFNNYKGSSVNNLSAAYSVSHSSMPQIYSHSPINSKLPNFEVHNFYNNERVSNLPVNHENCTKTMVIFHTIHPGYNPAPISNSNCKCKCCQNRHNELYDPNKFNNFINEIFYKYSGKK